MRVLEAKHSLGSPFQEIELGWSDFDFGRHVDFGADFDFDFSFVVF